jgi:hypothetical protein
MRGYRWILLLPLLLAACGGAARNAGGLPGRAGDATINWPADPQHVVFRVDVVGGTGNFEQRNDIPLCTVYGDSRVVWTADSQPGQTTILFDLLDPVTVRDFVLDLIVNEEIYNYQSYADVQLPSEDMPVYEQVILDVNNERHVTDGFEQWETDFFRSVLDKCRSLSQSPALFEPSGGWLTAAAASYDEDATIINWDAGASGIDLVILTEGENTLWLDNNVMPIVWNIMTTSPRNRLFKQDESYFRLAFQVPNVHRDAPPAPIQEELAEARTLRDPEELEEAEAE